MIDKALILIIFFYSAGLMMVGLEFSIGQLYGVEFEGCREDDDSASPTYREIVCTPIKTSIVGYLQEDTLNTRTDNIVSANYTANSTFYDRVETFTTGAAFVGWELVTLLTGTYIFWIMYLFGVPSWFVTTIVTLYILLLARAIIGYVRGI